MGNMPGMGNMPDMSNISDDQLNMSLNMMKSNPGMFKSMMEAQGMKVDDAQLDMMTKMMTPEMMRMAQNMQKSGMVPPTGAAPGAPAAQNPTGDVGAMPGMPGMGGMPNMGNMSQDQADAMKNMTSKMFDDPAMLKNMMNMMTSDPNGPMMQMLQQQFPNMNPNTVSRVMGVLSYFIMAYAYMRKIWSYTVTKIAFFCLCVYIVAWFLK